MTGPGSRRGTLLTAALAPIVWGSTYVVTTELLPPGRPLLVAALRALPAGLLLLAWSRTLPRGEWWWRVLVLGTLNIGAFFALLFVAAYRLPGGVAGPPSPVPPGLGASPCWSSAPTPRWTRSGCSPRWPGRCPWRSAWCSPSGGADRSDC